MNRTRLNLTWLETRENPSGTPIPGPYTPPPDVGDGSPPPADTGTPSPGSSQTPGPYTPPPVVG
ncbi:MAG: hypothetical protein K2X82_04130 [Gemmataceae bacterium]|nr:hypothetical protein [Gemmataceae bacterium]